MLKSPKHYRPEIDGLRAVSVLGVVLFHAGLGFPGGYVGVDVFFVISGFLISGIILKELRAGTFSLKRFWARRIRRILPAVSCMVALVLVAGYLLLAPGDFEDLARSSIAQSLMYANVFFLHDTGYFSEAADLKPLLHTWTLAVEEQFYLFFPILLAVIYKLRKQSVFFLLFAVAAASLAAGIWLIADRPLECFFLLPTRAWELLVGALLAVVQHKLRFPRFLAELFCAGGLSMIFLAMFAFDAETKFPGSLALLPVLGAAALIAGSLGGRAAAVAEPESLGGWAAVAEPESLGGPTAAAPGSLGGWAAAGSLGEQVAAGGLGARPVTTRSLGGLAAAHCESEQGRTLPFTAQLLASRPMVFVGLISYSLYLWHWPLFAFSKLILIEVGLGLRLTLVAFSLLLAYLSWRFVENPFRTGKLLATHRASFLFGLSTVAILFSSSHLIRAMDGIPQRFDAEELVLIEDMSWTGREFYGKKGRPKSIGMKTELIGRGTPDFVIWGDSHGLMMSDLVDRMAKEYQLAGEAYLVSARLPIPGLWRPTWDEEEIDASRKQNRHILKSILNRKVRNVILVGRWSVNCSGHNKLEGSSPAYLFQTLVTNDKSITAATNSPELASASMRVQLEKLLKRLSKAGVRVWLFEQVPETNSIFSARHFFLAQHFPFVRQTDAYTTTWQQHLERQNPMRQVLQGLEFPGLTILDPSAAFFANPEERLQIYSERSFYRDDDHLTRYGAEYFLGPMFEEIFQSIPPRQR